LNEESKKAGNADDQNPLASSAGTTIRSFSHRPQRSTGGALLSSFIRPFVCPSLPLTQKSAMLKPVFRRIVLDIPSLDGMGHP
jgi:hypothetical protein